MFRIAFISLCSATLACAPVTTAPDAGTPDAGSPDTTPGPVECGALLPGPKLPSDLVEAERGYDRLVATFDPANVDDPLVYGEENVADLVNYMLGRASGTEVTHDEALAAGPLGKAVLVAAESGGGSDVDLITLRRGLYAYYPCARPFPPDLAALKLEHGDYATWETEDVACGAPKDGPRRIHRNDDGTVYVAETLTPDGIRETEVLFRGYRTDGQLDFAAYTHDGQLSDRSTFATMGGGSSVLAAPITCMACHVGSQGTYDVLRPDGTGAGCR